MTRFIKNDVRHLEQWSHDVTCETTKIWCDNGSTWNAAKDIDDCTCLECLEEVRDFAKLAQKRWREIVRDDIEIARIDASIAHLHSPK